MKLLNQAQAWRVIGLAFLQHANGGERRDIATGGLCWAVSTLSFQKRIDGATETQMRASLKMHSPLGPDTGDTATRNHWWNTVHKRHGIVNLRTRRASRERATFALLLSQETK